MYFHIFTQIESLTSATPPKLNIAWWLEDDFPIGLRSLFGAKKGFIFHTETNVSSFSHTTGDAIYHLQQTKYAIPGGKGCEGDASMSYKMEGWPFKPPCIGLSWPRKLIHLLGVEYHLLSLRCQFE